MELNKILEKLCYYDKRNPNHVNDDDEFYIKRMNRIRKCSCDNCFYGRTELAEEILKLKNIQNETV